MSELFGKKLSKIDGGYMFNCVGCGIWHVVYVDHPSRPNWTFNNDPENPTFSPSVLVTYNWGPEMRLQRVCHSFIKEGKIQYLADCNHELVNQTVDLPDWTDD